MKGRRIMKRFLSIFTITLLSLTLVPAVWLVGGQQQNPTLPNAEPHRISKAPRGSVKGRGYKVVLTIQADSKILPYFETIGADDIDRKGPSSLSISESGNFVIANQTDNTVVELSRDDGSIVSKADFPDATAITDAIAHRGKVYVTDSDGAEIRVLARELVTHEKLSKPNDAVRDSTISQVTLRDDVAPVRLAIDEIGVVVNGVGGNKVSGIDGHTLAPHPTAGPVVLAANPFRPDSNRLYVTSRAKSLVNLQLPNPIAEAFLLKVLDSGDFYVYIVEMSAEHEIVLDHKILHFTRSGALVGQARVPAYERLFPVPNGTVVDTGGRAFSLIPRENGNTDIVQLAFGEFLTNLESVLTTEASKAEIATIVDESALIADYLLPKLTRDQVQRNADDLVSPIFFHAEINIKNPPGCTRVIPSSLRNHRSVTVTETYAWGGYDLPRDYQAKLNQGYLAGNDQRAYAKSCNTKAGLNKIAGIDCSGFVANALQMYKHPFSTSSLARSGVVDAIPTSDLLSGDILNAAGDHMVIFDRSDENSLWVWEATSSFGGRVGHNRRFWRELPSNKYKSYRYRGLHVAAPTVRFSAISVRGIAYEGSYSTYSVGPREAITFTFDSTRSSANAGHIKNTKWFVNGTQISTQSRKSFSLGPGTHVVVLEIINTEGGTARASLTIRIDQVVISVSTITGAVFGASMPKPSITSLKPKSVRRGVGTWILANGKNFQPTLRAQVQTPSGGPWPIHPSGVRYESSKRVWIFVVMGGSRKYTAKLGIIQNGKTASKSFEVR
jgi:hypothetical protein